MLRGLAVTLVAFFHAGSIPALYGIQEPALLGAAKNLLTPYRIPTLLFLSGLLIPRSLKKPLPVFYSGKVRAILWPFVVWTLITSLATNTFITTVTNPWTWISGCYHMWFLAVLMACYLVAPVTRWIPPWLWVIPMVFLAPIPDTNAYQRILWYGAFFYFGAWASTWVKKWQDLSTLFGISAGLLTIVGAVFVNTIGGGYSVGNRLAFLPSIVGILFVVWLAPRIGRITVLETIGRHSMTLYMVHFPTMAFASLSLKAAGITSPLVFFPACLIAGFGSAALLWRFSDSWLFRIPIQKGTSTSKELETNKHVLPEAD